MGLKHQALTIAPPRDGYREPVPEEKLLEIVRPIDIISFHDK